MIRLFGKLTVMTYVTHSLENRSHLGVAYWASLSC